MLFTKRCALVRKTYKRTTIMILVGKLCHYFTASLRLPKVVTAIWFLLSFERGEGRVYIVAKLQRLVFVFLLTIV